MDFIKFTAGAHTIIAPLCDIMILDNSVVIDGVSYTPSADDMKRIKNVVTQRGKIYDCVNY